MPHLMLEVHGVFVDDSLCDVVEARGLDTVQSLRLIRAEVEGDLGRAGRYQRYERQKQDHQSSRLHCLSVLL